jgi:hypothetical protein
VVHDTAKIRPGVKSVKREITSAKRGRERASRDMQVRPFDRSTREPKTPVPRLALGCNHC